MKNIINLDDIKLLYPKEGWPIYELYDKDDNFVCNIELIPDGWVGMDRSPDIFRWCFLMDKICIINDHNNISYIFELIDAQNYIFQGFSIFGKHNFYLKHIIA